MAIDVTRSRRDTPFKCSYWKRNERNYGDSNTLITNNKCDGYFYAKIVNNKRQDSQDIGNVWEIDFQEITLLTHDIVNIREKDLVKFNNKIWLVLRTEERYIQKGFYNRVNGSKDTMLVLRNG